MIQRPYLRNQVDPYRIRLIAMNSTVQEKRMPTFRRVPGYLTLARSRASLLLSIPRQSCVPHQSGLSKRKCQWTLPVLLQKQCITSLFSTFPVLHNSQR